MLIKIREKAQGVFAWVILIVICVPFALWGIQNYLGSGTESAVATVGDKEFFQRDLTQAYNEFSRNLKGAGFDEENVKQQALQKLIRDEVLLQYVRSEGLVITDATAKDFIQSLEYFQTDGKFNKQQFTALLNSQQMTQDQFVGRVKNALRMEQFQHGVMDSSFTTQYDIDSFFKIQNQSRDIEYVSIAKKKVNAQPTEQEIEDYYQQHKDSYQTAEQVSVQYVELSLNDLAEKIKPTDQDLLAMYEEQKDLYSTEERRKISHILFAFNAETTEEAALQKALKAQQELKSKDFAKLAAELSDDKLTAKNGGDLGLFTVGVMEPAFEKAASELALNEVSDPVKSAFGYHLIKVTELVSAEIKPFASVKQEVTTAYQKAKAENTFYELGETLTEVSYENPTSLETAADAVGLKVKETGLFTRDNGEGIASQEKLRQAAFSEDVLNGNNSEAIELDAEHLVVLRVLKHNPATVRALAEVKTSIVSALQEEKALQQVVTTAESVKKRLLAGESLSKVAEEEALKIKKHSGLTRSNGDLPWQLNQAVFKAAKPGAGKPTIFMVGLPSGDQAVVSLSKVTEGKMTESDKKQQQLAERNIAKVFAQATYNSVMKSLVSNADISVKNESN